jgi:hypothetical protein
VPTTDPVFASVTVGGDERAVVIDGSTPGSFDEQETVDLGLRVETGVYNRSAVAKVTVLDDGTIDEGARLAVDIRGQRVFTGEVAEAEAGVGDRRRLTAYGPIFKLKQESISQTFDSVPAEVLIFTRVRDADLPAELAIDSRTTVSTSFRDTPLDEVIEKTCKLADLVWFVSEDGEVVVSNPETVGESRLVDDLLDASEGKRTPAFQSVVVLGQSPASRRGAEFRHMLPSRPIRAEAGDGDPVFRYEDSNIRTLSQARNVASSIERRLNRQQKGGFVVVPGRPDVRPFDRVKLPPSRGGEEYLVSEVSHTVTKDGFRTRLDLGGLLDPDTGTA